MSTKGDRDAAIEALLRTTLRSGRAGAAEDCPPADVLAAYVEGSLGADERATAERHFAVCERCQNTLAALSDMPDLHPAAQPKRAWPRLGWLVPAGAVLTLLVVYVAVRPQIAQFSSGREGAPARAAAEKRATELPPGVFGGGVPAASMAARNEMRGAPPAVRAEAAPKQEAQLQAQQTPAAASPAKLVAQNAPRAGGAAAPARPRPAETDTRAVPAPPPSQATDALEMKAAAPIQRPAGAVSGNVFVAQDQAMAKAAAAAAPPAAGARNMPLGSIAESVAVVDGGAFVVTSRDGRATWRFDPQLVSRSTDNGISWRSAQTGATATLLSASSPTATVAWAVGMKGTIVRTADGEHWTRCSFPEAVDLVSVDARDDRTATVVTRDGRRFTTSDAGVTWAPAR